MRRNLDEQMDMVLRQCAADDGDAHFVADLADDLPHPQAHIAMEHLEAVLGRPDNMVAMVKKRVTATAIGHSL